MTTTLNRLFAFLIIVLTGVSCTDNINKDELLAKGRTVSMEAQKKLVTALHQKLEEGGSQMALIYCNENAIPLTNELALKHKVKLSRLSSKNRNPSNGISGGMDREIWQHYQNTENLGDTLTIADNARVYYKPIVLGMPTCLQCHGENYKDIDSTTVTLIKQHYPDDKATDYSLGALRGMWRIEFDN